MFSRLSPYQANLQQNPVFRFESRRLRDDLTAARLKTYSVRLMAKIVGAALILWIVVFARLPARPPYYLGYNPQTWELLGWLFVGSILADFAVDYVSLSSSVGSVNEEKLLGRWDLLRLTLLPVESIVEAKHVAAQLRVWRVAWMLVSFRASLLVILTINTLLTSDFRDIIDSLPAALLPALVLGAVYLLEPLWRMRAMTALGMAVSSYTGGGILTILGSVFSVFAVWVVQILFMAVVGGSLGYVLVSLLSGSDGAYLSSIGTLCASFIASAYFGIVAALTVRGFFNRVRSSCLERVVRRLIAG